MSDEQIRAAVDYIKTHIPGEDDFTTIAVAIRKVMGKDVSAAKKEDLVNGDDAWLIPQEEREMFAGIKGRGWVEGFTREIVRMFYEAVQYAKTHIKENTLLENVSKNFDNLEELKRLRNELINSIAYKEDYDNENNFSK